jgi:hypothetical protein
MNFSFRAKLFASAIALIAIPLVATPVTSYAQEDAVSFDAFHAALASHGDWVYSDRWGEVWIPADVPDDFHPYYSDGHWVNTEEYGLLWVSNYDWGDIPFHYGRWVNDPDDGWLWIPGYVWSPGWVVWRSNDQYMGWMPMPPDEGFLFGTSDFGSFGVSVNFSWTDDFYGYARWYGRDYDENLFAANWVFIGAGDLSDNDYRSHAIASTNVINIINSTTNITNYTVVNNYVVNRSVDVKRIEQTGGHPMPTVSATTVIKHPALITTADTGRAVQVRMREIQPRGTGVPNSAPKPSQDVVRTLSTRQIERHGHPPAHLFTQPTVVNAPLKPAGTIPSTPSARSPGSENTSAPPPSGERKRDSSRGNQDNQGAGSPENGAATSPRQMTPPVTPPKSENPPADQGGPSPEGRKGRNDNRSTSGDHPERALPPARQSPETAEPETNNPPADKSKDRKTRKDHQDDQGSTPNTPPE